MRHGARRHRLRGDQRAAKAEVALVISEALPKEVETFDLIDGVWVAHPRFAVPLAIVLRQWLIDLAGSRIAQEGQQDKMELMYLYLTGPRFRQRIDAIGKTEEQLAAFGFIPRKRWS